jgi:DNA polymerase
MTDDARPWVPGSGGMTALRRAAADCRGCELYRDATQVVFSDGPARARLVLVGEQPGDHEDRAGEPFVGPAGRLLDSALEEASIVREDVYLTNAVKHFRHHVVGKRRIHDKPAVAHVKACHPWLEAELDVVRPDAVVALGATAARAVTGRSVTIGELRGKPLTDALKVRGASVPVLVTVHPSSLLRLRDHDDREAGRAAFVADLRAAAELLA